MAEKQNSGMTVVAIGSIPLIMTLGNSMLIPILPKMKSELNLSQFQVSLVITVFSITAALFIPLLGYLADRFSRKVVIIPCLFLYGAGGFLQGLHRRPLRMPSHGCCSGEDCKGSGQPVQRRSQWR
ncbi:hypothetical protein CHCC15087_4475 [Bacillus licheniformis]|nr:hypothetical protein CHCC15087_4475 [Bacillus licheniformis]